MKIIHIVGARPNFMKMAPVLFAMREHSSISQSLVHTGQHYDERMSDVFFRELGLPQPDVNLSVGSASHAKQTAEIMAKFEDYLLAQPADWVCVYGDVNSTVACALVAAKLNTKVAHIEAGLRSGDRTMPEEINRIVTDQLSDIHLTPSLDGDENLRREGVDARRIHMVGNCMIDTLVRLLDQARRPAFLPSEHPFALVTLHRPSTVDRPEVLIPILKALAAVSTKLPVIFSVHPRTARSIETSGFKPTGPGFMMVPPQGYLEFLWLQQHATMIVTDSGGVQEEATWLKVPCLTMRLNTERPVTCTMGTNLLIGHDVERLSAEMKKIVQGHRRPSVIPPLWDGRAGRRVAEIILKS